MNTWMWNLALVILAVLLSTFLFFFIATRGALLVRGLTDERSARSHVYPIYSNMRLMRLVDFQPIISAILLFQYDRLVAKITTGIARSDLNRRRLLITSCAFGNVIPKVVEAGVAAGAERVLIADIIENELIHARGKLGPHAERVEYLEQDATRMELDDGTVDVNVMFFLLHELPDELKQRALAEAGRLLAPGGRLYLAEFHRPRVWVLRALSWTYFKVFEPLGLALWDRHDPLKSLERMGGWSCERTTLFFGNFQIIVATKQPAE